MFLAIGLPKLAAREQARPAELSRAQPLALLVLSSVSERWSE